MSVLINGLKMPRSCDVCDFAIELDERELGTHLYCGFPGIGVYVDDCVFSVHKDCPLIGIPNKHGRLIDADALIADLKRQCKEVFRIDAVSPDDFWITRNEAYNERLWTTWCESLGDYINAAPTIIEAME